MKAETKFDVAGVVRKHARCPSAVEVHADKSGSLHYNCGAVIHPGEYRNLRDADDLHLAGAIDAHLAEVLASDEVRQAVRASIAKRQSGHAADAALAAVGDLLGVEVGVPDEALRLTDFLNEQPAARCSGCQRFTYEQASVGKRCGMAQPDRSACGGVFR